MRKQDGTTLLQRNSFSGRLKHRKKHTNEFSNGVKAQDPNTIAKLRNTIKTMIEIHYKDFGVPKPNQPWLPSVHGVVHNDAGALLLHQRDDHPFWTIPGGKLELGESLETCLAREMLEETGLEVVAERLLGVFSSPEYVLALRGNVFQPLLIVFLCQVRRGELRTSPESLSFTWMDKKNIETLQTFPLTKDIARFLWSGNANAFFGSSSLNFKNIQL